MCVAPKVANHTLTSYRMSSQPIVTVDEIKYLGITVDNSLSFHSHILDICRKATNF